MLNRIMTIVALVFFLGFLWILISHIPRLDLGGVLVVTVALVLWDVYTSSRES
ncbi:hypothetical protein O4G76_02405 [Limimaricola sp. G21655-S1]|uniref:hypothetical protein n=1 Tax=unclassified Limimaricola TaxID=2626459 RepID=UPI0022AFEE50|nr:hypothetical protein [Limimaricola sp. G21655-S1]MCZ4259695.1 hypothetical protein [Limimaricola sp. G21655-S1]